MTTAFYYFWSALFGLIFGSFLNVVILRDGDRKSILTDRSRCMDCKHVLQWYDLFPLFSWLGLRGRCRYCKKPISAQYPLIEALSAALVVLSVWQGFIIGGSWLDAVLLAVALLALLAVAVIDIRSMEVPIEHCIVAAILGIILHWRTGLEGLVVGAGIIAIILFGWKALTGRDGMGEGDIWIAGAVGALVGWPIILISLMAAVCIGAVWGICMLGLSSKSLKTQIPFGPFLFAGLLVGIVWGQQLLNWYIL